MAGKVPLIFRLYKGDQFLREERLSLPVIKVGKLSSSHLRLDDESVSRMHAVIEVTGPGDISIIDLGSTKGTFVNGQKVNKAKLQAGDSIVVGDTRIDVSIGAEEVAAAPAAAAVEEAPRPAYAPSPTSPPPFAAPAGIAPPMAAPPAFGGPAAARPPAPSAGVGASPFAAAPAPMAFQAMQSAELEDPGARSVEVAAMMGDSVVSVKHVMSPRGGKVSPIAIGTLVAGAFGVILAAVAFIIAFRNSSANHAAYDEWVNVQKAPAYAFRAEFISPMWDALMVIGAIGGIFLIVFGVARLRRDLEASPWFRIGQDRRVEFATAVSPSPSFALVAPVGDEFVFNFAPGMEGDMTVDGQSTPLAELQGLGRARGSTTEPGAIEVPLPPKARIRVKNGPNTFLVSAVAQPRRQPVPLFAGQEASVWIYFGATAAVLGGLVFFLLFGLYDDAMVDDANMDTDELVANNLSATTNDNPPPEVPPEEDTADSDEESGGTGTAMALDEGKMGKKESDRATGQYKMAKTQEQEQLARQQAVDAAATAGILGSALLQQGGAFSSITATGDISSGFDDVNIYGGLLGTEAGEMAGGFGFGRTGVGPGGGGTGWGTIGTGRYGTIGHGNGTGTGYGIGGGRGSGTSRTAAVPPVKVGEPTVGGDLDREIIKRYIKRNLSKISYCYEKELLSKPSLAGVVKTNFLIGASGTVQAANGSGVDPSVASCVASVIKGIEFPKPNGGAGVQVNYPFTFRPTGS
jgi:predicted regulator of Ras-like GTPase activity (Roadblock/LC7/MglB family)